MQILPSGQPVVTGAVMDRRKFLKVLGGVGAGAAAAATGSAATRQTGKPQEFSGVLCDTTRCIGCRACEVACAEAHGLKPPDVKTDEALERERYTDETRLTVVNRYKTSKGTVYVKKQCMHCWQPACTSACLTNAMYKTHSGPVIWRPNKCMGCRFCMVSCPFEMPKFEYHSWNPKIHKCDMCFARLQRGQKPACVEACPSDALMFGKKRDLMEIARVRVYKHPTRYVHHVYGEYEVGGCGWLYLAAVPFEELGFRTDLGTLPYPEYTKEFLYAVPAVLIVVPSLLYGLSVLTRKEEGDEAEEVHHG